MNITRRLFFKLFALTGAAIFAGRAYATDTRWAPPKERVPPKTAAELYDMMCGALPVGQSTCIRWSVTGEEYIEYAIGVSPSAEDPEAIACRWMWQTFLSKAMAHDVNPKNDPRTTTLYWRVKPEFAYYDEDLNFDSGGMPQLEKRARIYLRYLISSKPAIYTEQELLENANHQELAIGAAGLIEEIANRTERSLTHIMNDYSPWLKLK